MAIGMRLGFLALLACLLLGAIALEWRGYASQERPAPVPTQAAGTVPTAAPDAAHAAQLHADIASILSRPLFEPGRRPPAGAAQAGAANAGLPRLAGIITMPEGRYAIFDPAGAGKTQVVAEGGRLNGMLVRTVGDGAVTVEDRNGTHVLHPSFSAGQAAFAAPVLPAAPAPRATPAANRPNDATDTHPDIPGLSGRPLGLATTPGDQR